MGMLRRGGPRSPSRGRWRTRSTGWGARISLDVSASLATVYGQVIERNVEPFIELLATLLESPAFPEEELGG